METFFVLAAKLLPVYLLVLLGFVAARYIGVKKEPVANLLIYIITPVVVFTGVATTKFSLGTISLPLLFFAVGAIVALITYLISRPIWNDDTKNMASYIAGSSNSGFFGLPVAVTIFGSQVIGTVSLAIIGTTLYLTSFGYYIAARGKYTSKDALIAVAKLPVLYGFLLGIIVSALNIKLGPTYLEYAENFVGAFVILGMMLIGIALAEIRKFEFDKAFISITFIAKFLLWPLITFGVLLADKVLFGIYDQNIHNVIMLVSVVPVAGNIIAYATILKSHPEKSSLVVFLSTLFALFYVPFIAAIFF